MAIYRVLVDGTERAPENLGEIGIGFERIEESGAYFWRGQLSGSLIFKNQGPALEKHFDYIKQQTDIDICQVVAIEIKQKCGFSDERTIFTGEINRMDCAFLLDSCSVECEVRPTDEYDCVLRNWEKEYNILDITNRIDLEFQNKQNWEFKTEPIFADEAGYGFPLQPQSAFAPLYTLTCPTPPLTPPLDLWLYGRIIVTVRCVGGIAEPPPPAPSAWTLLTDNCATDGSAIWWRKPVVSIDYGPPIPIVLSCTSVAPPPFCTPPAPTTNVIPIELGLIQGDCVHDLYIDLNSFWPVVSLRNGRVLDEVVEFLLQQDCPTLSLKSDFFEAITNPVTALPSTTQFAILFQKSDIVRAGVSTEVANLANLSLKELLADLNRIFNVWWYIDTATNELVLEHITDVVGGVGVDLTTLDGGKWAKNRNTISWDKIEVPVREQFNWRSPALQIDFTGLPINYDSTCTSDRVIATKTEQIETEVARIFQNEEESLQGFVLCSSAALNQFDVLAEDGEITGVFQPNAPFSWANLHRDYFKDYRYLPSGTLNGVVTAFNSTRPIKKQENLTFPICCLDDFNASELIKSEIGDGVLGDAEYNLSQQMIEVTIKFEVT